MPKLSDEQILDARKTAERKAQEESGKQGTVIAKAVAEAVATVLTTRQAQP
jgi:hypothetical protein